MISPWLEFKGEEVAECAKLLAYTADSSIACKNAVKSSRFLSLFSDTCHFNSNDVTLLESASTLDRVFTLPNNHARGLYFFGAQSSQVSATGSASSPIFALRSCLGEAYERRTHKNGNLAQLLTTNSTPDTSKKLSFEQLEWMANQQGCAVEQYHSTINWTTAKSLISNSEIPVPIDYVFRIERSNKLHSETSGMSTGENTHNAINSALLELVERDTVSMWWYGKKQAHRVMLDQIQSFRLISQITTIRKNSQRPIWFVAIENEYEIPVVAALSSDKNGHQVVAGFSANFNIFNAACSAMKEVCQMELGLELVLKKIDLHGENKLTENDHLQLNRAEKLNIFDYPQLFPQESRFVVDRETNIHKPPYVKVLTNLSKAGYEPFWIDLTESPDSVPCVRVIVPGLESLQPNRAARKLRSALKQSDAEIEHLNEKPPLI